MFSTLFNAFDEVQRCHKVVIPDVIRSKIIIYYIGFGTPTANLIKPTLTNINKDVNDSTLWRHIIQSSHSGCILLRSGNIFGVYGWSTSWGAMHELDYAYASSSLCDFIPHVKLAKECVWRDYSFIQFILTISNLTRRPEPIFGTPTACIMQRFFRDKEDLEFGSE